MKQIESKMGLITQQLTAFGNEELPVWNRARDMYQGRSTTEKAGDKEAARLKSSLNVLFAIAESAVASLLPQNPQVTTVLREDKDPKLAEVPEAYTNSAFDNTNYRNEQRIALVDSLFCGRAIYKTTWDDESGYPCVRAVDPRTVHFDLTARRVRDIRYWFEVSVLSVQEFRARVTSRKYKLPEGEEPEDVCGGRYPEILQETGAGSMPMQYREMRDYQPWVTVYEFYDVESGIVSHWHERYDVPLMQEKMAYMPYTLFFLNSNGQDCRGLSEALLTKSNIEDVNDCMTMWLGIVRRQIPRIGYDGTALSEEQMQQWSKAGVGDATPLNANGRPITDLFAALPMPQLPPDMPSYQAKLESNVAYVSALADNARGQVSGAKTATELALIQSQLQTRLASRQGNVDAATEDVAEKMLFLAAKYLGKKIAVKGTTGGWLDVARKGLAAVKVAFKVVPYSPLESNRAVIEERWFKALQYMQQRQDAFDWSVVDQQFVTLFRLDPSVLKPIEVAPAPELPPEEAALPPEGTPPEAPPEPSPQEIAAAMRTQALQPTPGQPA